MESGAIRLFSTWNLAILLVLLIVMFSILKGDTFLTAFTFQSMINSRSINALIALAVMIPLASNNYDLSVASILGISQVLANGLQTQQHLPWPVAGLICLALGAGIGLINGVLVTRFRINSFIATLGSGTFLLGTNQWYTGGRQVVGVLPHSFTAISAKLPLIGLPAPAVYVIVAALVLWVVFDYLPLGRFLYVIGDSPRAAELSGIPSRRYVTLAFIASGDARGLRRDRPAGAASGRPEHGRAGTHAAGVHRRPARGDRRQAGAPERVGHGARGGGFGGRGGGTDAARRAVLRREPVQRRHADPGGRPRARRLSAAASSAPPPSA